MTNTWYIVDFVYKFVNFNSIEATLYLNGIRQNICFDTADYIRYLFRSNNLLLNDVNGTRRLTNSGGGYILEDREDAMILSKGCEASFSTENWANLTDLTISALFKTSNITFGDEIIEFSSGNNNIRVINNNNKLAFQINSISVYEATVTDWNRWNYFMWNVTNRIGGKGFVRLNNDTVYYNAVPVISANYVNKLGSASNLGDVYIADFRISSNYMTSSVVENMYTTAIATSNYTVIGII
jgi:hypothetical protein